MKIKISDVAVFSIVLTFNQCGDSDLFFRTAVCYASAHFFAFTLQLTVEDRLIGAALCSVMLQWAGI